MREIFLKKIIRQENLLLVQYSNFQPGLERDNSHGRIFSSYFEENIKYEK